MNTNMKHIKIYLSLCIIISLQTFVHGFVSSWGERCEFTAQCGDHRLVCQQIDRNGTKICMCDRFHRWNGTDTGCVLKYTTREILAMLEEKYNVAERIQREADFVFIGQIIGGIIVMSFVFLSTLIVIGCCFYTRRKDKKLGDEVKRLTALKASQKPGPSSVKP